MNTDGAAPANAAISFSWDAPVPNVRHCFSWWCGCGATGVVVSKAHGSDGGTTQRLSRNVDIDAQQQNKAKRNTSNGMERHDERNIIENARPQRNQSKIIENGRPQLNVASRNMVSSAIVKDACEEESHSHLTGGSGGGGRRVETIPEATKDTLGNGEALGEK
eukprot:CAMPEP_0181225224 /NCGR_PEP_ID=MMETSP1096-20121128/31568_1 /TAXON_ID=156174 ORGANISM="Chrysochromulina ericina, Strain CCMP281" /NCGR_SAMPLE_ID=MMETSP1096 /ASSEMBLY_ACC=CAM_ASM_000453 /LENGTH=162 /DNA_ID=CAMNT_0023318403 /DNA_START=277 /DNA_END=768 /DNA_ORIENTATION=-